MFQHCSGISLGGAGWPNGRNALKSCFWLPGDKTGHRVLCRDRTGQTRCSQMCACMCLCAMCMWFLYTFYLCYNKPPTPFPLWTLRLIKEWPLTFSGRERWGEEMWSKLGPSWWSLDCNAATWLDLIAAALPVLSVEIVMFERKTWGRKVTKSSESAINL